MKTLFKKILRYKQDNESGPPQAARLLLTEAAVLSLQACIAPEIKKRHEGIAYLFGRTDGVTTLIVAAIRPAAETTSGSFDVDLIAMARVISSAADLGLQVVGQVHTHPGVAYHSDGDNSGARIAYSGYVSIVLPKYGKQLPSLTGAAYFFFQSHFGFLSLDHSRVTIVPGRIQ